MFLWKPSEGKNRMPFVAKLSSFVDITGDFLTNVCDDSVTKALVSLWLHLVQQHNRQ